MPIVRGQHAEALAPGLNWRTFTRLRERPSQFARYVDVRQSRKAYEDTFEMGGLGPLVKKPELNPTTLDEPYKLGGVRFIHETYALAFLVSQEMRDDEQYGLVSDLAGGLGRSSRVTTELYGHDVLNNGFTTTKYVGRDGLALFSTAHPLVGAGTTVGNRPAVDVDLSEAALEAGIGAFDNMVDDRGITTEMRAGLLVIGPNDRMLAKRLLNSAGMPGGQLNDINPLYDEGITVAVANWLTDPDAWFLLAAGQESPIKFYWREMPDTKTWDDDNADGTFHKIRQRHSTGFDDWRGAYGSPGA